MPAPKWWTRKWWWTTAWSRAASPMTCRRSAARSWRSSRKGGIDPGPASAPMTEISSRSFVSAYGRYAPVYDVLFGAVLGPGRKRMARTVSQLNPRSVLEVGVGTGLALKHYPREAEIVGIDLSPEMLARASSRAGKLPHSVSLHTMDAEHLDFPDDSFDCVTVPYVLSVTPDPARLVSEL